jgi:predicted Fe-Mo cluster-binding NifX family protein
MKITIKREQKHACLGLPSVSNLRGAKHLIAIPLENGRLCQHFGHCQQFALVEAEEGMILNETLVTPPPHEPGLLPAWLAEKGVTEVIAGGMGQRAVNLFAAQNIRVHVGAQAKNPKELVSDWLQQSLVTGTNACDH